MTVLLLAVLLGLFILRVAGQVVVAVAAPRWLPPMGAWYSGLIPYPLLLPAQLAIIVLMGAMIRQVARGVPPNRPLAAALMIFGVLYAGAMVIRIFRSRRHIIPIVFHWVLAAFLLLYAAARL